MSGELLQAFYKPHLCPSIEVARLGARLRQIEELLLDPELHQPNSTGAQPFSAVDATTSSGLDIGSRPVPATGIRLTTDAGTAPRPLPCFALRVKARSEQAAAVSLASKGFSAFLPSFKSTVYRSDRQKQVDLPLFPGYLFCRFDPLFRLPVLTTPGVFAAVGFGKTLIPIDEQEMAAAKAAVASGLPAQPWPYDVRPGDPVCVKEGPLRGVSGTLRKIDNKQQFVVSVSLLQRSVSVAIDPSWIGRTQEFPTP